MMNKFFTAVGQIAVGLVVGNAASDVVNKVIVPQVKKVLKAKKGEA